MYKHYYIELLFASASCYRLTLLHHSLWLPIRQQDWRSSNPQVMQQCAGDAMVLGEHWQVRNMCETVYMYNIKYGREVHSRYIRPRRHITTALRVSVNMLLRLDIEAMDRPTILYIIYRMVGVQQTNLFACDSRIFPKRRHFSLGGLLHTTVYRTSSQYVISYGCAITVLYIIYVYVFITPPVGIWLTDI